MSEESAIEAFNSNTAAKLLRDKVRMAFVELIPADEWEKMIKAEFDRFFEVPPKADRYDNGLRRSEFTTVCQEALRDVLKEQLKESDVREMLSKIVHEQLDARAPDLLRDIVVKGFGQLSSMVVQRMEFEIGNALQNAVNYR